MGGWIWQMRKHRFRAPFPAVTGVNSDTCLVNAKSCGHGEGPRGLPGGNGGLYCRKFEGFDIAVIVETTYGKHLDAPWPSYPKNNPTDDLHAFLWRCLRELNHVSWVWLVVESDGVRQWSDVLRGHKLLTTLSHGIARCPTAWLHLVPSDVAHSKLHRRRWAVFIAGQQNAHGHNSTNVTSTASSRPRV